MGIAAIGALGKFPSSSGGECVLDVAQRIATLKKGATMRAFQIEVKQMRVQGNGREAFAFPCFCES
jgi:hypothetical protein